MCPLALLLSYWDLINVSFGSTAELVKSEQCVLCLYCWAIEIWAICLLPLLLSYWNLSNLSIPMSCKYIYPSKPHLHSLLNHQNWMACHVNDVLNVMLKIWITSLLSPLLSYWKLNSLSFASIAILLPFCYHGHLLPLLLKLKQLNTETNG